MTRRISRTTFIRLILALFLGLPLFLQPAEADAAGAKYIVVSLAQQRVYAYQGNTLVFSIRANIRGARRGTFRVQNKIPVARSSVLGWRLPYWLGIYHGKGGLQNGFHGYATTSRGNIATNSLGCIVMAPSGAARLYAWARVGTSVTIK